MTRDCYFQMRQICKIRKYLSQTAIEKLCHAFITSRLDSLNSLLFKIPKYLLHKLQLVQNSTARIILKLKKHDHSTPALYKLHWLPIDERIQYKILLLVFKALVGESPKYMQDIIQVYQPSKALRSKFKRLLVETIITSKYGKRAFASGGPALFNKLPEDLRKSKTVSSFKSKLKTHLFKKYYKV